MPERSRKGGCYTCRYVVPQTQVAEAAQGFTERGHEVVVTNKYIAVEFGDGFDALFIRVGETSEHETAPTLSEIFSEFEKLNDRRHRALQGLRLHAVNTNIAVAEEADGRWPIQGAGWSSELRVGPLLTRLVEKQDAPSALVKLLEGSWIKRVSLEEADKLIDEAGSKSIPPLPWRSADQIEPLFGPGMLALDCKAIDEEELPTDAKDLINTIAPTLHSPGQQVVNMLVQQVGSWRFSVELLGKGEAEIEFTDKHDSFRIHPKSRSLNRLAEREGVEKVVRDLVVKFEALDKARSRALQLVENLMAKTGYKLHEENDSWFFGKTYRLGEFEVGRALTLKLGQTKPEELVHDWLINSGLLAEVPNLDELKSDATSAGKIQKCWLPKEDPSTHQLLPGSSELAVDELDRKAVECIRTAAEQAERDPGSSRIANSKDLLAIWMGPFWYKEGDSWASDEWFLNYANEAWQRHRRDDAAVLLMSAGKQPEGADFHAAFAGYEYWDNEAFDDSVLWHFVDELPWSMDEGGYPAFPARFKPRPAQIVRRAARSLRAELFKIRECKDKEERGSAIEEALRHAALMDKASALQWITSRELDELEQCVKSWLQECRTDIGLEPNEMYSAAAEFGWIWLPDVLEANPAFLTPYLTNEDYSDPGELALRLSWVRPCLFAARLAAFALEDMPAEVFEERARRIAGGPKCYKMGREIVRDWQIVDQFAAGIAWQRCRAAKVV